MNMRKTFCLLAMGSVIGCWHVASAQQGFRAPAVASASDAYVPVQVVLKGLLVADLGLNDEGEIQRVSVLRGSGVLLGAAKSILREWRFEPAYEDGKPRASRLTVVFLYRPPAEYGRAMPGQPKDFVPVIPPDRTSDTGRRDDFVPVGILSFAYPNYPVRSVASGSVVVQVTVSESGAVRDLEYLRRMAGFNSLVQAALKKWQFRAGTLREKPVSSRIVIAFVFRTPTSPS